MQGHINMFVRVCPSRCGSGATRPCSGWSVRKSTKNAGGRKESPFSRTTAPRRGANPGSQDPEDEDQVSRDHRTIPTRTGPTNTSIHVLDAKDQDPGLLGLSCLQRLHRGPFLPLPGPLSLLVGATPLTLSEPSQLPSPCLPTVFLRTAVTRFGT